MLSKLRDIVSEIAEQNEIKIEGYKMEKIRTLERHLDENGDIEAAMKELDGILGFHWDDYYKQIEKKLESK